MKKLLLPVLVSVLMAGCAAQVLSSSERSVVVQARVQDLAGAQTLADAECKKQNRFAKLASKTSINQFVYDCVN